MPTKSKKTKKQRALPMIVNEVQIVQLVKESEITEVINAFRPVNPSYYLLFGRQSERNAAERLISRHGYDRVISFIRALPQIHSDQYCPRDAICISPAFLEKRLGYAVAHWSRMQQRIAEGSNEKPESMDFRK